MVVLVLTRVGRMMRLLNSQAERLSELADTDYVTGLPTCRCFTDRLSEFLGDAHGQVAAFLLIDVERFSQIHDTLGHRAGDAILHAIGVRLREHHLRSFSRREILARELAHLKAAYLSRHDLPRAAASVDRLLILDDRDAYELRDRATLAMQMHAYELAMECLERYLSLAPHAEDLARVREQMAYLRAWMEQN